RGLENLLARHHDAEIDDLEVVALQHDPDDVLADVVHVALDCRHDDAAVGPPGAGASLALLDVGDEIRYRALHDPRALDDLRQEHLPRAEQIADDVHAVHERSLDDLQRMLEGVPRLLGILDYE